MRIISVRHCFDCDHSSVSYQFVSDGRISPEVEAILEEGGVDYEAGKNTIYIHNPGGGYMPSEVERKILGRHDIPLLIYEDYDWWNFAILFDYNEDLHQRLEGYNSEEGVYTLYVTREDGRIAVWVTVVLDYSHMVRRGTDIFKTLRELLLEARRMIIKDDYEPLEILHAYCTGVDLSQISHPTEVGEDLKSYLLRLHDQ